ncbi:Replication protein A 70 kDa DNA-binding subunit B, partial [Bienertia sinuspersici]
TVEAEQVAQIIDTLPVLKVSRVTASTLNGGSFNTTFASTMKINPNTPTAQLLHDVHGKIVTLKFWHGGTFKMDSNGLLIYGGRDFRTFAVDGDELSWFELVELAKKIWGLQ